MLVCGIHRGVALVIKNALVELTCYIHNESDMEWDEDIRKIFLGLMAMY